MIPVKTTLLVNGISSGATGIALAAFAEEAARLFEVNYVSIFRETGVFLVLFAAFVLYTALQKQVSTKKVKLIIEMDIAWVLASVILVIAAWSTISALGTGIILAVAGWVGLMAYLQFKGNKEILPVRG